MSAGEKVRVAAPADAPAITETLSRAFHDDPTWSWAFPDEDRRQQQYAVWWGLHIEQALRFAQPAVFVTDDIGAAAIWLPPGQAELSPEAEAGVPDLLRGLVGERASELLELIERFEAAQPATPPHYYLSLLGVDDDHRGNGIGMALLEANLTRFDAEGVPTYLESSNSANDHRYEARGYRRIGEFTPPGSDNVIAAYWRDPA